jgi:hypothetical protein
MLLATLLLMCPLPQSGAIAKSDMERPAAVSEESSNSSTPSKALPAAPDAKIKTDAEVASGNAAPVSSSSAAVEPAAPVAPAVGAPVKSAIARDYDDSHQKKEWYALMAVSSGAAVFDAWSTRRAISGGYGTEANPLLRPFSHSNAMYAATQVSPLVLDLIGRKMMTSKRSLFRKLWWVPQMAGTDMSVSAGIHNVSIVH